MSNKHLFGVSEVVLQVRSFLECCDKLRQSRIFSLDQVKGIVAMHAVVYKVVDIADLRHSIDGYYQ